MNKKTKVLGISTASLFLVGLSTTLGFTLSSCSKNSSSNNLNANTKLVNVSSNIASSLQESINLHGVTFPEQESQNIIYIDSVIDSCTSLNSSEYSLVYGTNSITINISNNSNKVFSNAPENTKLSNNGKTLTVENITWSEPISDDLSELLKKYNWWMYVDYDKLQTYITNNKIFSDYIINNYSPNEIGIDNIIFQRIIASVSDKSQMIQLLLNNYTFSVDFLSESNGYMVGNLKITSKNYSYRFKQNNTTTTNKNIFISDNGLTLNINNLKFPTYIISNPDNENIYNNIQSIFDSKPIETNNILNNEIVISTYNQILKYFGNVEKTNVPIFNENKNVSCKITIDDPNSYTYMDFFTPATIEVDFNGSNIKINSSSTSNIEYKDGKIFIHVDAPVTPYDVVIQNPNLSNDIIDIINTYQIEDPNDLKDQYSAVSEIFEKINQSYVPDTDNDENIEYTPIENYITQDQVSWNIKYAYSSRGIKYYNLEIEINENINKEFSQLEEANVKSIEIKDADNSKEHYKNKILIINNIKFYMPYQLIDTSNLQDKIQQAINDLKIISYKDFSYYKDEFFKMVFGNTLPSNKASVEVTADSIKITINEDYPYKFNIDSEHSKVFECPIEWFTQEYVVNDETFDIINNFINKNNIQKNTNISIYSQQLIQLLFGNNVYQNDVSIEIVPIDPNDYNNTNVQFKFNVKPDSNLIYILGELSQENAQNVIINDNNELLITLEVSKTTLEINTNVIQEQYLATIKQLGITNYFNTLSNNFKQTFSNNVYNALKLINSPVPTYINETQFYEYIKQLTTWYSSENQEVTMTSNMNNIKFLTTFDDGNSSVSNTTIIHDVIF